jgi:hypothetical protein
MKVLPSAKSRLGSLSLMHMGSLSPCLQALRETSFDDLNEDVIFVIGCTTNLGCAFLLPFLQTDAPPKVIHSGIHPVPFKSGGFLFWSDLSFVTES